MGTARSAWICLSSWTVVQMAWRSHDELRILLMPFDKPLNYILLYVCLSTVQWEGESNKLCR